MTYTLLILIPTILMALLFVVAVRRALSPGNESRDWQLALSGTAGQKLPSAAVLRRVFSVDDLEFVARERSEPLLALLLKQRSAIATSWLRLLRAEMLASVAFHRRAARTSQTLLFKTEFMLGARLVEFAVMYLLLSSLLQIYGPFAAKRLTYQLQRLSSRLYDLQSAVAWQSSTGATA